MNLDEFLKENPDTLGCLMQKYLRFYWKAFPSPVHVFVKMRQKYRNDKIQTPLCFFFFFFFFVCLHCVRSGLGREFHQQINNTLRHPEMQRLSIDFLFNKLVSDHTTGFHWFFLPLVLRQCRWHMVAYAGRVVNY